MKCEKILSGGSVCNKPVYKNQLNGAPLRCVVHTTRNCLTLEDQNKRREAWVRYFYSLHVKAAAGDANAIRILKNH